MNRNFKLITGIFILILFYSCAENNSSKSERDNQTMMIQTIDLRNPDNSMEFFKDLKLKSEAYWETIELNQNVYGFQTQKNTKWNEGLTDEQIDEFEAGLGIKFPQGLRNYYRVMNGVNLPAINIYGNSGEEPTFSQNFYSYPDDLPIIKDKIKWIYEAKNVNHNELIERGISRIFPVFAHRFVLTDNKDEFVLSMYGDDIIYWTDNISKLLAIEIFEDIELPKKFTENPENAEKVKFWLD